MTVNIRCGTSRAEKKGSSKCTLKCTQAIACFQWRHIRKRKTNTTHFDKWRTTTLKYSSALTRSLTSRITKRRRAFTQNSLPPAYSPGSFLPLPEVVLIDCKRLWSNGCPTNICYLPNSDQLVCYYCCCFVFAQHDCVNAELCLLSQGLCGYWFGHCLQQPRTDKIPSGGFSWSCRRLHVCNRAGQPVWNPLLQQRTCPL